MDSYMTPKPDTTRRLLRLKEAAIYVALSPGSLRRLVQAGELPVIVLAEGHSPWLLDVNDLNDWIDRSKRTF
jgi:hypothetical protein